MSLTNDIKRLREKLEVFNTPRINQVITDLLNYNYDANSDFKMTPGEVWKNLKQGYQKELNDLVEKQSKYKQGQIKF